MTTTKMAPSTGQHNVGQQAVLEEDHSPAGAAGTTATTTTAAAAAAATAAEKTTTKTGPATGSSGKPAVSSRVGDEVCIVCPGDA